VRFRPIGEQLARSS